jgi:hypothetical protein
MIIEDTSFFTSLIAGKNHIPKFQFNELGFFRSGDGIKRNRNILFKVGNVQVMKCSEFITIQNLYVTTQICFATMENQS